jgi:succinate-semialdehyde dehydrogenase / glutarate-semialdehyde dehydrogenase
MNMKMNIKRGDLLRSQGLIGGVWCDADTGESFSVTNPATGDTITHVPRFGRTETERAIAAAEHALPQWRAKTAGERAQILRRWYLLMMEHQADLSTILTYEQGKPLSESRGEVAYAASFLEWFGEEAKRVYGDVIPGHSSDRRLLVLKQPVGVVAAITPWNFPIAMITRKVGPALAAGCTIVVKPASETPLSALAAAVLAIEAGVPAGVLNIITGSASVIGPTLTHSPIVRKISFTGSTDVGRQLMRESASTIKKISLELGGNAPFIVFDDADIHAAVRGAMQSKFRNAGQTCVCTNRILVQDSVHDEFVSQLSRAMESLKLGPGWEEGVTVGPLINEKALASTQSMLAEATSQGVRIVKGGKRHELGGLFFEPTLVVNVENDSSLAQTEIFAPVAPVIRFKNEADAIEMANATEFGLASYFYSQNINRIIRVGEALEYGMVGVNEGLISTEVAPFGGVKSSGLGREGSKYGMDDYLELKYICIGNVK